MPSESTQKKLGRVRPPRVHITYDVQVGDAIQKRELPFVVGVLADLSGQPDQKLPKLSQRNFIEVDRENFDRVMERQTPRLAFKVDNKLVNDGSKLGVELRFNRLDDFRPESVAKNFEPLRKLVDLREKLSNLRSELYGNDKLGELLQEAVRQTEQLRQAETTKSDGVDSAKPEITD